MPQVSKFTAPSGEIIKIYYSSHRELFYAKMGDAEYTGEKELELLKKLEDIAQYKYNWQAVIEITVRTEAWDGQTLEFNFERYYVAKHFDRLVESDWENLNERGDWRSESNHYIENFQLPFHNPQKGKHIIEYDSNIWENLIIIRQLIIELGKKIGSSFENDQFLNRLRTTVLKALPWGKDE